MRRLHLARVHLYFRDSLRARRGSTRPATTALTLTLTLTSCAAQAAAARTRSAWLRTGVCAFERCARGHSDKKERSLGQFDRENTSTESSRKTFSTPAALCAQVRVAGARTRIEHCRRNGWRTTGRQWRSVRRRAVSQLSRSRMRSESALRRLWTNFVVPNGASGASAHALRAERSVVGACASIRTFAAQSNACSADREGERVHTRTHTVTSSVRSVGRSTSAIRVQLTMSAPRQQSNRAHREKATGREFTLGFSLPTPSPGQSVDNR